MEKPTPTKKRRSAAVAPAMLAVVLAGAGGALGVRWGLSIAGVVMLALGFSAFSAYRAIAALLDRPITPPSNPGAWSRDRAVVLCLLALTALVLWGTVLFRGDATGMLLFWSGVATWMFLGYAAYACTTPGSHARWLAASLALAIASVSGSYFAGASAANAASVAGAGQPTTNWEQVRAHLDPALNAIRKQLNIVIANTEEIKKDTSSLLTIAAIEAQIDLVDKNPNLTQAEKWVLTEPLLKQRVNITQANVASDPFDAKTQTTVKNLFKDAPKVVRFAALARVGLDQEADALAAEIERTTARLSDAEKYEFFVARGDRSWNTNDFWNAATWYAQAMALRVDDPAVVDRAARSATLAPGKTTYTQDVQLAQWWVERNLAKLATQPGASVIDTARLHATLATTLLSQGKSSAAIAPAREALRLLAREKDAPAGQAYAVLVDAADALRLAGALPEAAAAADRAVAAAQAAFGERSDAAAFAYASRAGIRQDRGDLAGAEADIQKSINWEETQAQPNQRELAIRYASRASIRQHRGDLAGAEADIQKSITWGEAQSPRDERTLAIWYASRASIRQHRGDLAGAEEDIQKSIDWEEAQTQPNQRALAILYASRASIRQHRGLLKEAEADIQKSIDWFEAQSPRDERGLAIRYASRASIRQDRGLLKEAEADLQKSINWEETQAQPNQRELAIRYASRASIRRARGDLAGAEADIQKSITWYEAQSPRDERGLAIDYASRASIRQFRGLLKEAEEDIQKSIDWEEAQTQPNQRELAIHYATRADIRRLRGDLAGAEADLQKSITWGEAQSPRDERSLAIWYASRARILEAQAFAARKAGDVKGAAALFAKAKADIAHTVKWFETNMPTDERGLAILRQDQASIDQAARGE